eukprot:TRINITY_DN80_c0_g1_i1.p1 TRINITY_DN80_c0_g1~~TRINITY_DN80_c0_g1_i1.p1  ORF type:complete len:306 (+),score=67.02 TRINITY_DN80_c0_g1_i1:59-976(+)
MLKTRMMVVHKTMSFLLMMTIMFCCCVDAAKTTTTTTTITNVDSPQPFDINMMYSKLMFAYAAYCPDDEIIEWKCKWCQYNESGTSGFVPVKILYNNSDNTLGFVGYQGDVGIVSFRGTEIKSLANWITDLDAGHSTPYKPVPNAFVHTGFLDAWDAVKTQTMEAINNVTATINPKLWHFTGHSLGAAVAELAAVDLTIEMINIPIIMYNFGAPRVGNQAFVDYYEQTIATTYRATNQRDIVPHVPYEWMGFRHPDTEVWWNTATTYKVCNASNGEDPTCSDSEVDFSIPDHLDYLDTFLGFGGC